LIIRRPSLTLLPLAFTFSFLGISLTPSFIPSALLITTLLVYTRKHALRRYSGFKISVAWITLTVSIALSHLQPSIHSLSSTFTSIMSLALLSAISSTIGLIPIVCRGYVNTESRSVRLFSFPLMWTTLWLVVSRVSPLGRLITWTPLSGIASYEWILPYFGFSGIDFLTALWASVANEGIEDIISSYDSEEDLIDLTDYPKSHRDSSHLLPAVAFLLLLAVPSFFISPLPLPSISSDTTLLKVACILPQASTGSQFDRFMAETEKHLADAKILLWPEGAVTFETEVDKERSLKIVRERAALQKAWIGVSYEERLPANEARRDGQRRNGLALVGPQGIEFTYYKRKLVPIAESFSQVTTDERPEVHAIELHRPREIPKENWNTETRPIPITASICLDFSAPLTMLSSRPALILAPAKTWHQGVGNAMYQIARARGREVGADVLWCDGGAGGVSGIGDNIQVGSGSFVKWIGVPYPPKDKRTPYGLGGDSMVLAFVTLISGAIWALHHRDGSFTHSLPRIDLGRIRNAIGDGMARLRRQPRENRAIPAETQPLLIET